MNSGFRNRPGKHDIMRFSGITEASYENAMADVDCFPFSHRNSALGPRGTSGNRKGSFEALFLKQTHYSAVKVSAGPFQFAPLQGDQMKIFKNRQKFPPLIKKWPKTRHDFYRK